MVDLISIISNYERYNMSFQRRLESRDLQTFVMSMWRTYMMN